MHGLVFFRVFLFLACCHMFSVSIFRGFVKRNALESIIKSTSSFTPVNEKLDAWLSILRLQLQSTTGIIAVDFVLSLGLKPRLPPAIL